MFIRIILVISLVLLPTMVLAQQASSQLGFAPEHAYRSTNARLWIGSAEEHQFNPDLAQSIPFPPFGWINEEFFKGEAWYEIDIPDHEVPDDLAGVLITRVYLTADVYLNGALVGSGGSMTLPLAKNAHRPLYFTIPQTAWQPHSNKMRIHHKSYPNFGYVVDLLIGSDAALRPIYEQRNFQQQSIPKIFFIVEILAALLLFYIWLLNRQETSYLWFSVSMVMISIFTLNQFLIDTIVPHKLWMVVDHTAIDWWAISLLFFVNAKLGIESSKFNTTLVIFAALALVYYIFLPIGSLPGTSGVHAVSILMILLYTGYIAMGKNRKPALPYILFFSSLLLMALHDILMQTGIWLIRWLDGYFILYYAAPLACFLVFGKLIRDFVKAMEATKTHAASLEMHIKLTKQELEEQYEKLNSLVEERAIEKERERIYRDLHDDVGSKLLSLFYRANDSRLEVLAKSALEDLRDIVSRKTLNGELLENAVKQWELEARERVTEQGIELVWNNINVSNRYKLDESQYTHIKRMLREAISNALRHNSKCEFVRIDVTISNAILSIDITNDGIETDVNQWQFGRGINNMFIRARELNGEFAISGKEPGYAKLHLSLPISRS